MLGSYRGKRAVVRVELGYDRLVRRRNGLTNNTLAKIQLIYWYQVFIPVFNTTSLLSYKYTRDLVLIHGYRYRVYIYTNTSLQAV